MNLPNQFDDLASEYREKRYYLKAAKILEQTGDYQFVRAKIFASKLDFWAEHPLRKEFERSHGTWYSNLHSNQERVLFLLFLHSIILSGDSLV